MQSSKTVGAVVLATSVLARSAAPETDVAQLQELVEEALSRNPALAAARQSVAASEEGPAQAGSLPAPTLTLAYQNDGMAPSLGSREMTMLALGATQEIPYPGKRGLRRQVAEADAGLAALDLERVRLSLVASVKQAYHGLRLARGLAALAEDQGNVWREIQETARVRYASAVGPQQELLRAQIESTRAHALHAQHHAEARVRLTELNRLLGRPMDTPLEVPPLTALDQERRTRADVIASAESNSPELNAALAIVRRDELALDLAGKEFKPDLAVQGAYVNRGGLDPMWQAGVSIALPARGRARAAVTEAAARLAGSRARAEDIRLRLDGVVEQRLALLEATEQIELTYREGLLPQDQIALESALAGYRTGQGGQASVFEPMVSLLEDRIDHLRLLASHAAEQSRLEELSLEPPAFEGALMHGRSGLAGMGAMGPGARGPAAGRAAGGATTASEMR